MAWLRRCGRSSVLSFLIFSICCKCRLSLFKFKSLKPRIMPSRREGYVILAAIHVTSRNYKIQWKSTGKEFRWNLIKFPEVTSMAAGIIHVAKIKVYQCLTYKYNHNRWAKWIQHLAHFILTKVSNFDRCNRDINIQSEIPRLLV